MGDSPYTSGFPLVLWYAIICGALQVWDIITNRAVLEMNAAWAGEAGRLVQSFYNTSQSTALIAMPCSTDSTTQRWILDPNHTGAIQSADEDDGRCMEVPDCTPIDHNFGVTVGPCHVADVHANCSSRNQQWDLNTSTGYITSRMARPPSGSPYSVLNVYDMTGPGVQMFYPDPGTSDRYISGQPHTYIRSRSRQKPVTGL